MDGVSTNVPLSFLCVQVHHLLSGMITSCQADSDAVSHTEAFLHTLQPVSVEAARNVLRKVLSVPVEGGPGSAASNLHGKPASCTTHMFS